MATAANTTLSRVTIVSPRTRMDLALPSDVPLADLLPTIMHQAGEYLVDEAAENGGWVLSRLGGKTLEIGRSPSQLSIRDGEILYLTPSDAVAPEIVFDDVIDAIATATNNRGGRWDHHATRSFAVLVGICALLAGALAALLAGPPSLPGALTGLIGAAVLTVVAALISRAMGDSRTATYFAITGIVYAGVGGLLIAAEDRSITELSAPHVMMAAAGILLFSVFAILAVGDPDSIPVFLTSLFCAIALGIAVGCVMLFDAQAKTGAAIAAPLMFAMFPMIPKLALQMAQVPTPQLPSTIEEMKTDSATVDGKRVLELSERANGFLVAMYGGISIVGFVCALVLALTGDTPGWILATILSLVLLSRARPVDNRPARIPLLAAGMGGLAATGVGIFLESETAMRLTFLLGGFVLITVIAMVYGVSVSGKKIAPTWGRLMDILEGLMIVSIIPLAAWIGGAYDWIQTVRG